MPHRFIHDRRGTSAIEFAIVASLISVAGIAAFVTLGDASREKFASVEAAYRNAG